MAEEKHGDTKLSISDSLQHESPRRMIFGTGFLRKRPPRKRILHPSRDPRFYLAIIWFLFLTIVIAVVAYVLLWTSGACESTEVDTALLTLASASVGALAATLTQGISK